MGYDSDSASQDDGDEDGEEYDDTGRSNRFLGFMFGNVDNSGDLDADYLDEDAKEHLAALADKLGPSLTAIDLSVKRAQPPDTVEQDYDEKNEDAVDYEDIDEQYEGPEVDAATEEDYLLPKKEYLSAKISVTASESAISVFDDDDYDDFEKENVAGEKNFDAPDCITDEQSEGVDVVAKGDNIASIDFHPVDYFGDDNLAILTEEFQEVHNEPSEGKGLTSLPVLCVEGGMDILRFSEIFGVHKPLKKGKKERRHSTHKERYKSMNVSYIVEEDEEAILKDYGRGVLSYVKHQQIENDISVSNVDDPDFDIHRADLIAHAGKNKNDTCSSAEPLREGLTENDIIGLKSQSHPVIYPIDQQKWEDEILWDNSPASTANSAESCEISGYGLGVSLAKEKEHEITSQNLQFDYTANHYDNRNDFSLYNFSEVLEPFGSRQLVEAANSMLSPRGQHPQLLRLESSLAANNLSDDTKGNNCEEVYQFGTIRRFSRLSILNNNMLDGSWLDNIIWESDGSMEEPKLILDLQDKHMLYEISDNTENNDFVHHAGAVVVRRSSKSANGDIIETSGPRAHQSSWQDVGNDSHYVDSILPQPPKSGSEKRPSHGIEILHSEPALKLQTMKLKLTNKDLANFHRPKASWYPHDNEVAVKEQGKLPNIGPMKILVKCLGGKGSKLYVDAEETILSVKDKASKKLDFKPSEMVKVFYLGRELEEDKSLAAQSVQPNSLLHLVRSKIYLLQQVQSLPFDNKSLRPPGAFKKKTDLSVKDGHVFLMEYCEERPLLLSNVGMGARLCTYYQKSASDDQTGSFLRNGSNGHVILLDRADKSPFLGDIKVGSSQSSLETKMYRAPIFPHKVPLTDYLLIRSAKGKLFLRRIDRIHAVGQQEPLMEVISPGSKRLQNYMMNRLNVYVCREFLAAEKRRSRPYVRAEELPSWFPYLSEPLIRKKLRASADLMKSSSGQSIWIKKPDFRISKNDLRRVTPEDVCRYESMQAGLCRLKHLGIGEVFSTAISSAVNRLPDDAIALAAASHIERELLITPWNLSSTFVSCMQGKETIERLEITGVGDPSGRGLGFSYVRAGPKAPTSNVSFKKKSAAGRGGSTVTGTDADLRRLSMDAAREVLLKFNVPEEQIAKLTRWHRIAMIRRLSSEQAVSGVHLDPTTINKYARGQRMSFLQLQQQTREKCQEIWERQTHSLTAIDGDTKESDSEENSDLDSFAGDLENLLDAEECEDAEVSKFLPGHENVDSVKGIQMRKHGFLAQAEEEIEDEAAEAAELCRLLMDDNEGKMNNKKKKRKVARLEAGWMSGLLPKFNSENAEHVRANINTSLPEGSFTSKDNNKDPQKVEYFHIKKDKSGKVKSFKKNEILNMNLINKRLKISGDKVKNFKEKKSARENFGCGRCHQFGHMRTNKNCPLYGKDFDVSETTDQEKPLRKLNSLDSSAQSYQKTQLKKPVPKIATKTAVVEAPEGEKSSSMSKVVPLKFKCSSTDRLSDIHADGPTPSIDQLVNSDHETEKSSAKINKITFFNKTKIEDSRVESYKPSIVIKPPDANKAQVESRKPSFIIRPLVSSERDVMESPKRTAMPRLPDNEQRRKKIKIKQPKEIVDVDLLGQDGSFGLEYRKTKRIAELSSFEKHRKPGSMSGKELVDQRWWVEQEVQRPEERSWEDRTWKLDDEEMRNQEQQKLADIRKYEADIRREREEEEQLKAKRKMKKKNHGMKYEFMEDPWIKRKEKRPLEGLRSSKRRNVEFGVYNEEYVSATKRRRGGKVGLSNILERIVETLKERYEVSYLFLKPVSKKEAPDYLDIIKTPMDLSTIKEKVRKMEYMSREEFRHDVCQIAYNAHLYNDGRNPGIPPLADQLLEICDYLLNENDESLTEAEAGIDNADLLETKGLYG